MWSRQTIELIHAARDEDLGSAGDITTRLLDKPDAQVTASLVSRAAGVICGLTLGPDICSKFAERLGRKLEFESETRKGQPCEDGGLVAIGDSVATLRGPRAAVLAVERTLLNFLGRMSGVATLTREYVEAAQAANPAVTVLDTRKTIPGWRELDKYAVRTGGGTNHRKGLYDAVLIKDNHLAGIPLERLADSLSRLLAQLPPSAERAIREAEDAGEPPSYGEYDLEFVEVEVDNLEQLAEVSKIVDVDVVLLDNFTLEDLRKAVQYRDSCDLGGKLALEASGKVTLETIAEIAGTGVDRISVGALTHSAPSLDLALDF